MSDTSTGFFGKLPSHGDFIDRGLARGFIQPWDDWLQRALAQSRLALAEDWLAHYMIAPIWRFVLAPGLCGDSAWQGILLPSVDRVNRHFPLTLALSRPAGSGLVQALLGSEAWYAHCEAIALQALSAGLDADNLYGHLAQLPPLPMTPTCMPGPDHGGPLAWQLPWQPDPGGLLPAAGLAIALAETLLALRGEPLSLWATEGSERVGPCLLVHRGLPDPAGFTALLTGDFAARGWSVCLTPAEAHAPSAGVPAHPDRGGLQP